MSFEINRSKESAAKFPLGTSDSSVKEEHTRPSASLNASKFNPLSYLKRKIRFSFLSSKKSISEDTANAKPSISAGARNSLSINTRNSQSKVLDEDSASTKTGIKQKITQIFRRFSLSKDDSSLSDKEEDFSWTLSSSQIDTSAPKNNLEQNFNKTENGNTDVKQEAAKQLKEASRNLKLTQNELEKATRELEAAGQELQVQQAYFSLHSGIAENWGAKDLVDLHKEGSQRAQEKYNQALSKWRGIKDAEETIQKQVNDLEALPLENQEISHMLLTMNQLDTLINDYETAFSEDDLDSAIDEPLRNNLLRSIQERYNNLFEAFIQWSAREEVSIPSDIKNQLIDLYQKKLVDIRNKTTKPTDDAISLNQLKEKIIQIRNIVQTESLKLKSELEIFKIALQQPYADITLLLNTSIGKQEMQKLFEEANQRENVSFLIAVSEYKELVTRYKNENSPERKKELLKEIETQHNKIINTYVEPPSTWSIKDLDPNDKDSIAKLKNMSSTDINIPQNTKDQLLEPFDQNRMFDRFDEATDIIAGELNKNLQTSNAPGHEAFVQLKEKYS